MISMLAFALLGVSYDLSPVLHDYALLGALGPLLYSYLLLKVLLYNLFQVKIGLIKTISSNMMFAAAACFKSWRTIT